MAAHVSNMTADLLIKRSGKMSVNEEVSLEQTATVGHTVPEQC